MIGVPDLTTDLISFTSHLAKRHDFHPLVSFIYGVGMGRGVLSVISRGRPSFLFHLFTIVIPTRGSFDPAGTYVSGRTPVRGGPVFPDRHKTTLREVSHT